jgi:hypothetical protein
LLERLVAEEVAALKPIFAGPHKAVYKAAAHVAKRFTAALPEAALELFAADAAADPNAEAAAAAAAASARLSSHEAELAQWQAAEAAVHALAAASAAPSVGRASPGGARAKRASTGAGAADDDLDESLLRRFPGAQALEVSVGRALDSATLAAGSLAAAARLGEERGHEAAALTAAAAALVRAEGFRAYEGVNDPARLLRRLGAGPAAAKAEPAAAVSTAAAAAASPGRARAAVAAPAPVSPAKGEGARVRRIALPT